MSNVLISFSLKIQFCFYVTFYVYNVAFPGCHSHVEIKWHNTV